MPLTTDPAPAPEPLSTADLRVRAILAQGFIEAYGLDERDPEPTPCTVCGAPPALEYGECDRGNCPTFPWRGPEGGPQ